MPITRTHNLSSDWTPAATGVLRRAVTLAGNHPVDIATIVAALEADVPAAASRSMRLTLNASGVLRAADELRSCSGRSVVSLVDLVAALSDAAFTHPAPELIGRRLFLSERLAALSGGTTAAAPGIVAVAEQFGRRPSELVSR